MSDVRLTEGQVYKACESAVSAQLAGPLDRPLLNVFAESVQHAYRQHLALEADNLARELVTWSCGEVMWSER